MVAQLIYVSTATEELHESELDALLAAARDKNARLGITGMLLYATGNFIQAIEGEPESVYGLFDTIRADPRHRDIQSPLVLERERRDFPDWSMGYSAGAGAGVVEAVSALGGDSSVPLETRLKDTSFAHSLMRTFAEANR